MDIQKKLDELEEYLIEYQSDKELADIIATGKYLFSPNRFYSFSAEVRELLTDKWNDIIDRKQNNLSSPQEISYSR